MTQGTIVFPRAVTGASRVTTGGKTLLSLVEDQYTDYPKYRE